MTNDVRSIVAELTQAQGNAIVASAVMVPRYRDGGVLEDGLVGLQLARRVAGGAALTRLGRQVRIELKARRK